MGGYKKLGSLCFLRVIYVHDGIEVKGAYSYNGLLGLLLVPYHRGAGNNRRGGARFTYYEQPDGLFMDQPARDHRWLSKE